MAETAAARPRELSDYTALVRRRWRWVAGALVAGLVAAVAYMGVAQPTYVSTAKVLVAPVGSDSIPVGARTNDGVNLDTEAQIVTSVNVAQRAADILETGMDPVALARRVTVTVPPNTTVLQIAFAGGAPQEAQLGAAAFARAYLDHRQESAQRVVDAEVERLQDQIESTQADVEETSVAIARLRDPAQKTDRAFLVARRNALSTQLASFNAELAPLAGATVNAGEISHDPQLPTTPVDPNPMLVLPTGLVLGLVAGLGLAAWRERTDDRLPSAAEVDRVFGLAPLALLRPGPRGRAPDTDRDLRALYHALRAGRPVAPQTVALVAPESPALAERLAQGLAVVAARSGARVSCLTGGPAAVSAAPGRSAGGPDGLQMTDYGAVEVVVDGEFRSGRMRELLGRLRDERDLVVLGLPDPDPALGIPMLGRDIETAVLVIHLGRATRRSTERVLSELTRSGVAQVLAVTVGPGRRGGSGPGDDLEGLLLPEQPQPDAEPVRRDALELVPAAQPPSDVEEPPWPAARKGGRR